MNVWATILRRVEAGEEAALVSVAATEGSALIRPSTAADWFDRGPAFFLFLLWGFASRTSI